MKKRPSEGTTAKSCQRTNRIVEETKGKIMLRTMHMVMSVHAKFGVSATKIERGKCSKFEVLNKGNLAHKCISLISNKGDQYVVVYY